jgi:hypothetical protein
MSGQGRNVAESPVYRAPMRSRDDRVADGAAVERALATGVCGMGGRLDQTPATLPEARAAVEARYGERVARRIERFASLPGGTFVWTRDVEGLFWLGRLAGPWRFDASPSARDVDLVHVRDCVWSSEPIAPSRVPAAVTATFARGGRNGQRIGATGSSEAAADLWARLHVD